MKRSLNYLYTIVLFISIGLLAGCASPVFEAQVTTYQKWVPDNSGSGFMLYAFNHLENQEVSLEQATYEDMVRPYLERVLGS